MDDFIERLENEIWQQTRNGRTEVYIDAEDLNKLSCNIDPYKKGRIFVDAAYLRQRIKYYKFRDGLKVEPKQQTFRELEKEIKNIEKSKEIGE